MYRAYVKKRDTTAECKGTPYTSQAVQGIAVICVKRDTSYCPHISGTADRNERYERIFSYGGGYESTGKGYCAWIRISL